MYIHLYTSKPEKSPIKLFSRVCSFALKYTVEDLNDNGNRDNLLHINWYRMEPWQRK